KPMKVRLSRRRFMTMVPLSVLGAAALAACGASPTPTTAPASAATKPAAAATTAASTTSAAPTAAPTVAAPPTAAPAQLASPVASPTAVAQANLAPDQSLRLVSWTLAKNIAPQLEGGPLRLMTENTFRPPFVLDKDGKLQPGVCTKWTVSDDGLKYTLTMDPNAKFSDGSKVTAADLKFSWEYLTDPNTKSGTASYVTAAIVGYADMAAGKATAMSGLVVKDDATLEITLSKPYTPFIKAISTFIAGVVKKDNVLATPNTKDDKGTTLVTWDAKPVCCGPYQLKSWDKASGEINWEVNPYWWGPKPTIQKVNYRYVLDPNTESIMYDNNEMDVLFPSDLLRGQLAKSSHAKELVKIPYGGTIFYYFPLGRKPMEDVNVRRALLKATDMGTIVQAVFQGSQQPAYGIVPPNIEGYANPKSYYDPDGAKKALAASTYQTADKLPPITIEVPTNTTEYVKTSEALQQMWKDTLGINITIHTYASGTDPSTLTGNLFRLSLGTIVNDPAAAASALGLSTNSFMKTYVLKDYTGPVNTELDGILNKADSLPLTQEADRVKLYQQAEQMIMDQAYYIPITFAEYYHAVKPWVQGFASNTDNCFYTLPEAYIAKH
ncbi:MAG: ABC transporter substrate-binding protein, partial [Thermomicrobiales bacterium]